ncbi:MAG: UDP-N-acetylmuramate dehydrogenase [Patescibacteria group bacterium]|nr:UDP-N-acetylmuramate dehydrogenase [Patescibacteria group bacterium]
MKIQENIFLSKYTTFKIGGSAKYFLVAKTVQDLKQALSFAKQNSLQVFILGGGSNLLVSDDGFDGVVIKMEIKGIVFNDERDGVIKVSVGAGEGWDNFVKQTVEKNLIGLENLSLIPGTVGASVVQNIGAFGVEVGNIVSEVEVFDKKTLTIKKINNSQCDFDYRSSLFKTKLGSDLIVIKVVYDLRKEGKLNYSYPEMKKRLENRDINVQSIRDTVIQIRKERYPNPQDLGSAGCFFKNPIISQDQFNQIKEKYSELPFYKLPKGKVKIPVAWLIDEFGWKGCKKNKVGVYKKHSLILINYGGGTSKEIKKLANEISKDIFLKTNLNIFYEVVFLK